MKKTLISVEFQVVAEKKEYYKQRKMTANFERLIMIKKEFGELSPEYLKMEKEYSKQYG